MRSKIIFILTLVFTITVSSSAFAQWSNFRRIYQKSSSAKASRSDSNNECECERGPMGPRGPEGEQGPQGLQGPPGPACEENGAVAQGMPGSLIEHMGMRGLTITLDHEETVFENNVYARRIETPYNNAFPNSAIGKLEGGPLNHTTGALLAGKYRIVLAGDHHRCEFTFKIRKPYPNNGPEYYYLNKIVLNSDETLREVDFNIPLLAYKNSEFEPYKWEISTTGNPDDSTCTRASIQIEQPHLFFWEYND